MATGIGGEVLWICPTLSSTNDVDDLSGNISTPSTHSGASVISETGTGGTHSISFNGTQGLDLGSATIHSGSTFSYSCWFKTTQNTNTGGGAGLIGQYIIPNDRGPCLALNNAQAHFYYQSNGGTFNSAEQINNTSTSNDGNWHHVAAVFDGPSGIARLYVNGAVVKSDTSGPSSVNQTRNLFIGDMNGGLFNGSIDDVRAFDKVLTDQEIVALAERRGYEPVTGINFRQTPAHATDDLGFSVCADDSGSGLSLTYSAAQGYGWDASLGTRDRSYSGYDNNFAGIHFTSTNGQYFRLDLPSGAGAYKVWAIHSDLSTTNPTGFRYKDGTTVIATVNGDVTNVSGQRTYRDILNVEKDTEDDFDQPFESYVEHTFTNDHLIIERDTSLQSGNGVIASVWVQYQGSGGGGGEGEGGNLDFHPFNSTHVLD